MSRVWEHSGQRGGALLILLALADFADDDGYAWPAVPTLATKARMTERNARYALRSLEADGEITTVRGGGRHGTSGYVVNTGAKTAGGQILPGAKRRTNGAKRRTERGLEIAPEPSLGTVIEPSISGGANGAPDANGAHQPIGQSSTPPETLVQAVSTNVNGTADQLPPTSNPRPDPLESSAASGTHVPGANDAPGELDQLSPPKQDAWLPLKMAIATTTTGKPKVTGAKGAPAKWIGEIVGDVGKLSGGDPETALLIWSAFDGTLTNDDREKYINAGNVGQRFVKWSANGGVQTIRGIVARRERKTSGAPRALPDWMIGSEAAA